MVVKIVVNVFVIGTGVLAKAFVQAFQQALTNASKAGVAQETLHNVGSRACKTMTQKEARQILGVAEQTPWEEIMQKYTKLFEKNSQSGSFYLQSKVHRAKECLESLGRVKK